MVAETVLYNSLAGSVDITSVVDDRIYSDIRDQGDIYPAIYFERVNTEYLNTLDTFIPSAVKSSFIVTCFEKTREESQLLAAHILLATATAEFLCTDQQNGLDEETGIYTTTVQLNYLEVQ